MLIKNLSNRRIYLNKLKPRLLLATVCFYFILSVNSLISLSDGLEENICPVSHLPPLASSSNNFPLLPIPEEADVQKGITVLFVKSFALTNVFTGQAAIPHQIG